MSDNEKEAVMTKMGIIPTLLMNRRECRDESKRIYANAVANGYWSDKQARDFNYLVGFESGLELAVKLSRKENSKHGK
jgi:hypothetical protein